jgi:S-adenosylmethionine/arginine decarboxylase-like enzyme
MQRPVRDRHSIPPGEAGPLGSCMYQHGISFRGSVADPTDFLKRAAVAIGMTAVGDPVVWRYPTAAGLGGEGVTAILPIAESFLALDLWPRLGGGYFIVNSCCHIPVRWVHEFILPDLVIVGETTGELSFR